MLSLESSRSGEEWLSDPGYALLKEHLIASTGLSYYADKDADLVRRIRRRMASTGHRDWASYLERLRDPCEGPVEMDALIAEITIGESYFFRHREHFDALRDIVIPSLISQHSATRRLRIWCAGCADGAEPYSLSILLRRDLAYLLAGWEISILGTDINRRCLAAAREGRFEEWSFRATPPDVRRFCFQEAGKHWAIAPDYRTGVSFRFHNLVEDAFPPPGADFTTFDLIVCRNVMIYFDPERMRRVIGQLHECLAPGAWLLVGPSEPNMTHFLSFRAVNAPGVTLYQRPGPPMREEAQTIVAPAATVSLVSAAGERMEAIAAGLTSGVPAILAPAENGKHTPTLDDLRRSADRGDWEEAARYGRELLRSDSLNPAVHFHYALVMEQMGNQAEMERALRRAIYLDRQAPLAHYHLGLLLQSHRELRPAIRCFANALELVRPLSPELILPDADGITAAELTKLVRSRIDALSERI
jgi:chemotaxis protein methyltransferase CheR